MQSTLDLMLSTNRAVNQEGHEIEIHSNIGRDSVNKIRELIQTIDIQRSLEVGMASGISTLAILGAHSGHHIAVDPNQTSGGRDGWQGIGLTAVRNAGLEDRFTLLEESSHLALPRLSESEQFDFIFIDGWHSFDYTLMDIFYSDLLLRDGGVLVVDDWGMPQVAFALKFLIAHKPYEQLGPRLEDPLNPFTKLRRRFKKNYDKGWGSIRAFRKLHSSQVPWHFFESSFYPWFQIYQVWMKLRGLKINKPF